MTENGVDAYGQLETDNLVTTKANNTQSSGAPSGSPSGSIDAKGANEPPGNGIESGSAYDEFLRD